MFNKKREKNIVSYPHHCHIRASCRLCWSSEKRSLMVWKIENKYWWINNFCLYLVSFMNWYCNKGESRLNMLGELWHFLVHLSLVWFLCLKKWFFVFTFSSMIHDLLPSQSILFCFFAYRERRYLFFVKE